MDLSPLLTAAPNIQIHVLCATLALVLGPVALWRKRRDALHKNAGYVWYLAMIGVCLSGLTIPAHGAGIGLGPLRLGPLHLFVAFSAWGLIDGFVTIRRGNVAGHKNTMENLFYGGLCIAGLFNFLPGRRVNRSLFPDNFDAGLIVLFAGLALALIFWARAIQRRRRRGSASAASGAPAASGKSVAA